MFTRKEIMLLAALACAKFTHILDFMVMMPLGPQLMRILNISTQQFSFLVSSYTISAGIFAIVSAFFIDRFDRKKILLAVYVGFIVGTALCAVADSFAQLMLGRIVAGMFGGLLNTLILSIVGDTFQLQKRATATGVVMSAMSASAVFGVPIGVYFAATYYWNMPFNIVLMLSAPVLLGLYVYVPSTVSPQPQQPTAPAILDAELAQPVADTPAPAIATSRQNPLQLLSTIFTNFNHVKAFGLSMSLILGQFMIIPFISPYMVKNIGFSELDLTYIYLTGGALSLITSPLIGRLADKFGHKRVFMLCAFGSMLPLLLVTNLPPVPMYVALLCTSLFFIFIGGRSVPSMTMVVSSVRNENRASFMSFNTAFQQFAAGIAALLSGSIVVEMNSSLQNYQYVGYVAIGLTIFAMFVASSLRPAKQ